MERITGKLYGETVETGGGKQQQHPEHKQRDGNDMGKWQNDEELIITDYNGDCIENGDSGCAYSEFTDTNVLRIVDLTSMGFIPEVKYNGLFLSNVWDCGQYTENGEGTPYEKYMIDDSATAENYYDRKYRNGKRYHNG